MSCSVVWHKQADVSEVLTASTSRALKHSRRQSSSKQFFCSPACYAGRDLSCRPTCTLFHTVLRPYTRLVWQRQWFSSLATVSFSANNMLESCHGYRQSEWVCVCGLRVGHWARGWVQGVLPTWQQVACTSKLHFLYKHTNDACSWHKTSYNIRNQGRTIRIHISTSWYRWIACIVRYFLWR
jgi:hypothetical protein